ncbi:leucine-rich repeat domain-containing protein [Archangium violaceum]|uniref:hypothetical protein n=1 Tax=Archangium violaceum TaxID=83451 RepID=UPI0036DAF143
MRLMHQVGARGPRGVLTLLVGVLVLSAAQARAGTFLSRGAAAVLPGMGFESTSERWLGVCVTGDVLTTGQAQSSSYMAAPLRGVALEEALGLPREVVTDTTSATDLLRERFLRTVQEDARSLVLSYGFVVGGRKARLENLRLTGTGNRAAQLGPADRRAACGDELARELEIGGRIFVAIRFDFTSEATRTQFLRETDISQAPASQVGTKLRAVASYYQGALTISVHALQLGGDPRLLRQLIGGVQGAGALLRCQVSNVAACAQLVDDVRLYMVGAGTQAFWAQVSQGAWSPEQPVGPAPLRVTTEGYATAGLQALAQESPHGVSPAYAAARTRLAQQLATASGDVRRMQALASGFPLSRLQSRELEPALEVAGIHVALLRGVLERCAENVSACLAREQQLASGLLLPYSMRVANAPEWFLPLCLAQTQAPDPALKLDVLRAEAGETDCVRASEALEELSFLSLRSKGLTDARPLAWLGAVRQVDVRDNQLASFAPLGTLANMERLQASYNQASAVAPLVPLELLRDVRVQGNPLGDAALMRARQLPVAFLTEEDVCAAARLELLSRGLITQADHDRYTQQGLGPVFATAARDVPPIGWVPCTQAARALDP